MTTTFSGSNVSKYTLLIHSHMQYGFVSAVTKCFKFATFSKDLSSSLKISVTCSYLSRHPVLCVCVVPRKRGYCSLQAYYTYPMCVQCSHFYHQEAPHHNDAGDPSSERWSLLGEKCPVIWPKVASLGIFYMPQIYDMGQTVLLPLRRKSC
jgi:hypothetical protein